MKTNYNRDWLNTYRTNLKTDNSIYKNYQNPSMTKWDTQMGGLSPAQKERYEQFINTIPDEVRGLSAPEMQRYLQNVNEKQEVLGKERAAYNTQIQNIAKQRQEGRRAQLRAQNLSQTQPAAQAVETTTVTPSAITRTSIPRIFNRQEYEQIKRNPSLMYSLGVPITPETERLFKMGAYQQTSYPRAKPAFLGDKIIQIDNYW